jgi:hypothetical protein
MGILLPFLLQNQQTSHRTSKRTYSPARGALSRGKAINKTMWSNLSAAARHTLSPAARTGESLPGARPGLQYSRASGLRPPPARPGRPKFMKQYPPRLSSLTVNERCYPPEYPAPRRGPKPDQQYPPPRVAPLGGEEAPSVSSNQVFVTRWPPSPHHDAWQGHLKTEATRRRLFPPGHQGMLPARVPCPAARPRIRQTYPPRLFPPGPEVARDLIKVPAARARRLSPSRRGGSLPFLERCLPGLFSS